MTEPKVGIVMGSRSDWPTMRAAAEVLAELGVGTRCGSSRRTARPTGCSPMPRRRPERGLAAIIAGAGGAAHLPGMLAAKTRVPVLGVPVESKALGGLDSLLSIVQMPKGVPVATFAIGAAGAANAGLFAAAMLAVGDPGLAARLEAWRAAQSAAVAESPEDA
jgi:5-(carboxyamino)imidazole ribonucleotide mutase